MTKSELISTAEAAELLGISRVAVFRRIKLGKIKAQKVGRNFVIEKESLGSIFQEITPNQKKEVSKAVLAVTRDYREALSKLGQE